ncbi:MAG: translocation/assembly module TamB domain-containing protein, partial [Bacteroidales bacterium]|nr:translocation/assembly module TamB domain-containing protein [Bacteroidales bacterium]
TSVASRRTVNCGVNLKGSLSNPELSFAIDIPDLDPITKGRVESALSTPDKVQRQFMALILSGSFVPDEQSGIFNNTTILYSNASEIVANQFNNIFRQLEIPLDLGLNYQPGSGLGGKDMFDVALSYQAFNNRLIINGNVGNSETSSSAWAGNLEVEYKVDKQGKLRLNLFTRAADSYSNYLDNTQRSGLGISFQDEFDTFGELFRNIFYSRKRKEQYELERMRKALEELQKEAEQAKIKKEEILKPKEDPFKQTNEQSIEFISPN